MPDNAKGIKLVYITGVGITQWWCLRGQNKFIAKKGFDLHSIASPDKHLSALSKRDGVTAHPVSIPRRISPLRDFIAFLRLFFILLALRPQVVHLSTPKASVLGSMAAWAARVPISVYLIRGLHSEKQKGFRRKFFSFLESIPARLCSQTICVSPSLLEFARSEGIIAPDRGAVVANGMSNGVDVDHFDPVRVAREVDIKALALSLNLPPKCKVIGFVGRLAVDKGIHELVCAWQTIRNDFPESHLLLIGHWMEQVDEISQEVRKFLEEDPCVHLTGNVEDPAPYYALMSVFVLPTHGSEGWPNVAMEASAMELPVIATKVVGCVDAVIDGITGMLTPLKDETALADAIRMYLDNPELCKRHGKAGRERVIRDFRQEIVWEGLYAEYLRLLRRKGLPVP
jgi:glycosyltransferase involved in cell wall biosynthesis